MLDKLKAELDELWIELRYHINMLQVLRARYELLEQKLLTREIAQAGHFGSRESGSRASSVSEEGEKDGARLLRVVGGADKATREG